MRIKALGYLSAGIWPTGCESQLVQSGSLYQGPDFPCMMARRPGAHKLRVMQDRKGIALRQLRPEETELLARLSQFRKALSVLGESEANAAQKRPRCRADLLRERLAR